MSKYAAYPAHLRQDVRDKDAEIESLRATVEQLREECEAWKKVAQRAQYEYIMRQV